MNKNLTLTLLGLGLLGMSAAACAGDGWYGALDYGSSHLGSVPDAGGDNGDSGYRLAAGYDFSRNFALEAGYVDFGKAQAEQCVFINVPCNGVRNASVKAHALALDGIGRLPLDDAWSLFGRLGLATGNVDLRSPGYSKGANSTGLDWGFGAAYRFGGDWSLRLQWVQFQNLGDSATTGKGNYNLTSIGIGYSFH